MTADPSSMPAGVDVLVVGGGAAGLVAALRARRAGRSVLVVTRAGSATSSWSGALDVACDLVDTTPAEGGGSGGLDALDRGEAVADAVTRVAARLPRHPYARLGAARVSVEDALRFLQAQVPGLALQRREDGKNHVLATALGTVKRGALVPQSQLLDLADLPPGSVVGLVEWRDLAGWNAHPVVQMLRFVASLSARAPRFVEVVVHRVHDGDVFSSAAQFAAFLDRDDNRARALAALRAKLCAVDPTPTHLLTPAVLSRGVVDVAAVDAAVGRPLRELLALPPSLPGERLLAALRDACARAGVDVKDGVVENPRVARKGSDARVEAVDVVRGPERVTVDLRALVLASGRFLAGGLVRDHVAREALLGLPIVADGVDVSDQFIGNLTGDAVDAPHAIFRAGIAIDDDLRPLGHDRRRAFDNVVCAGSIIGGYDPTRDGSALGVAVWTGWLAGQRAAEAAA